MLWPMASRSWSNASARWTCAGDGSAWSIQSRVCSPNAARQRDKLSSMVAPAVKREVVVRESCHGVGLPP